MAENLTPQQAEAVQNRGGKLLVSAAAGSGKTKVLVDRLMSYLMNPSDPANLDEFLIITYTKAAASELRGKIAAKLTEHIAADPGNRHLQKQMQRLFLTKISTVHGFCADLLREYAYRLDLAADFRVADENECAELRETVLSDLLDRAYEKAEDDADFRAFVDTQGLRRDDRMVADIVLRVFDSAQCHLEPDRWLSGCLEASNVAGRTDAGQTIWGRYLMDDLFSYLDCLIAMMKNCIHMAEQSDNMEKVVINLSDTLHQWEYLRQSQSWDEVVQRKRIDYGRLTFPKKNVDEELKERIKACRSSGKDNLEKYLKSFADESKQVFEDLEQVGAAARGLVSLVRQFTVDYGRAKAARRVLDFGDLEHKTLDLLLGRHRTGPTAVADEIGQRFREIMVDEYQDSNGVQDAIFEALTRKKQNCFMVGDVKQSIYQFRLADPGIFLEKYHSYVPTGQAEPGQGRKVMLSANFRSGGEVISAVNDVFEKCMSPTVGGLYYGENERLNEGIPHISLPDQAVELNCIAVREDSYAEEAAFVAEEISAMLDGAHYVRDKEGLRPIQPEDIVILLRSPKSSGWQFQRALESKGIRCATAGGTDLLQTEEIATLRAILQTVANPRQDIPLIAALASPVFGFTADDLAAFRSKKKHGSVYEALMQNSGHKAREFLDTLAVLRQEARMNPIAQLIERIFALTRMDSIYAAMDGGEARASNLQIFYQLAADYENGSRRDLNQFLDFLQLQEEKGLTKAEESAAGCVSMLSIHKSKGLEFPVVFLCGLSKTFNRENLRAQVLCDRELGLGLSVADTANRVRYPAISKRAIANKATTESLSEEMRVLYVAMTRARDRLIMTFATKSLQNDLSDISLRLDLAGSELITRDVSCAGEWVLLAAMQRMEAGELFALGGRPDRIALQEPQWRIRLVEAPELDAGNSCVPDEIKALPAGTEERLRAALAFNYEHIPATQMASKQTATQRKGRFKDEEAAEDTIQSKDVCRNWRKPSFLGGNIRGKAYGNVVHTVMQYIRYDACGTIQGVQAEIDRMVSERILTEEQGKMVDVRKISGFFRTELGEKLRSGVSHVREFKFSILDEATSYGEGLEGEKVLLQGVVDCALLEEDGMTVLDFKTDYVTEETLAQVTQRYKPQVETYAKAMERIYEQSVKASYLYFFHLDRFVKVS